MTREQLEALREFADTDTQRETLETVIRCGSNQKAAKFLGKSRRTVDASINAIKKKAVLRQGPLQTIAPEGYMSPGAILPEPYVTPNGTLQIGPDGKVERHWPRYKVDDEKRAALLKATMEAFCEDIPRSKPIRLSQPNRRVNEDLMNLYIVTDYHIGMYAWSEETGADWDVEIAEEMLVEFFRQSIASAPAAGAAMLGKLGDFLHWDGIESVTPTSGHVLDADTRFPLLVRVANRVTRRIIAMLLQKYPKVYVLEAEGNHDIASSVHSRDWLAAYYEDEPRVEVDTTSDIYYCHEWGNTSLFFHHGHKKNPENVDRVFVAKYREIFGRTKHSYAHMGDKHHFKGLDTGLITVVQHPTLAAPDAYASRGGWMSKRAAKVLTYHKTFGQVGELTFTPEMLLSEED